MQPDGGASSATDDGSIGRGARGDVTGHRNIIAVMIDGEDGNDEIFHRDDLAFGFLCDLADDGIAIVDATRRSDLAEVFGEDGLEGLPVMPDFGGEQVLFELLEQGGEF